MKDPIYILYEAGPDSQCLRISLHVQLVSPIKMPPFDQGEKKIIYSWNTAPTPTVPYNFEPKLEKDEQLFHS